MHGVTAEEGLLAVDNFINLFGDGLPDIFFLSISDTLDLVSAAAAISLRRINQTRYTRRLVVDFILRFTERNRGP